MLVLGVLSCIGSSPNGDEVVRESSLVSGLAPVRLTEVCVDRRFAVITMAEKTTTVLAMSAVRECGSHLKKIQ